MYCNVTKRLYQCHLKFNNTWIQQTFITEHVKVPSLFNERKNEQAHILHAPTMLENAVYNKWQLHLDWANRTGNWTDTPFHLSGTK